jgi:hypothetical protein
VVLLKRVSDHSRFPLQHLRRLNGGGAEPSAHGGIEMALHLIPIIIAAKAVPAVALATGLTALVRGGGLVLGDTTSPTVPTRPGINLSHPYRATGLHLGRQQRPTAVPAITWAVTDRP